MIGELSHKRRAAVVGMFDGVHLGHQMVVAQLRKLADEVGTTPTVFSFDRHPLSIIAPERCPKLLTTVSQRSELLVESGADDVVILVFNKYLRTLDARDFLELLHDQYAVDYLVVGYDHHFGRDRKGSFEDYCRIGEQVGVHVVRGDEYIDTALDSTVSSSMIRRLICEGNVAQANELLGHTFGIRGNVGHGRNIGETLGFPTANINPMQSNQLLPKDGVYAAWAHLHDGTIHPAMVNIGRNPTVDPTSADIKVEAHIIDFEGDLYGMPIEVDIACRLREERRFSDLESLTHQLHRDRSMALIALGLD